MLYNNCHHNKDFINGKKLFMDEKQVIHPNCQEEVGLESLVSNAV